MQGTGPASVTSATTAEMDLVHAISDAWVDIQNFREQWRWMRGTITFSMTVPDTVYTPATIFGPNDRLRTWKKETLFALINDKMTPLFYLEYDKFIHKNINEVSGRAPSYYTIRPWDNALVFPIPDEPYFIQADYQKTPQYLVDNTDVPECPAHFHYAILYYGVQKYDTVVIANESFDQYAHQYAVIMGQMMRSQLDKKVIITRGIA